MAKKTTRPVARAKPKNGLLPGELPDLYEELKRDYGPEVEEWLDTPHERLNLHTPRELLGTKDEARLRNLLRLTRYIGMT